MEKQIIKMPVLKVKEIKMSDIIANDYNPNKVATPELKLLTTSIKEDGLTMPIVVFYDKIQNKYIIVDGFHRYTVFKKLKQDTIAATIIEKDISQRMASTIRHNRARGEHQVDLTVNIILELYQNGLNDLEISKQLGMSLDEVLKLKQRTGVADIFKNHKYSKSWE